MLGSYQNLGSFLTTFKSVINSLYSAFEYARLSSGIKSDQSQPSDFNSKLIPFTKDQISIIETSLEASLKYADSEYISEVDAILKEIKNNTRFGK